MVYIIGVDHLIQYNGPVPEPLRQSFKQYLRRLVTERSIRLIAEEFSMESLYDVYGASEGTAESAAISAGIDHRYCDPEAFDRCELEIPYYRDIKESVKAKHGVRESFILDPELRKSVDEETRSIVKEYWGVREEYWMRKIIDAVGNEIVFICGWEHAERFASLLEKHGIPAIVEDAFWEKDQFRDYGSLFRSGSRFCEIPFSRSSKSAV